MAAPLPPRLGLPSWGVTGRRIDHQIADAFGGQEKLTADALIALLNRIGPAILVPHSQATFATWIAIDQHPNLVKALVEKAVGYVTEELDHRELFDRAALPGERLNDDWIENAGDLIRSEGRLVGCHEWDSGGREQVVELSTCICFGVFFYLRQ
jgi:hypothetical protein